MKNLRRCLQTGLLAAAFVLPSRAGTFTSDFNSGVLPPGTATNANNVGGAFLELSGGVGNSGCLKLTKNINSENGSFIIDDFNAGATVYGFDVTFKLRMGGGSSPPADGMSLSVGGDVQLNSLFGEGGVGSGLRFDWDIYNNPDTPPSPGINVRVGPSGNMVAYKGYTIDGISTTGNDPASWFTDVHIRLNPDGSLVFDYKGANVFTNFFVPGYNDVIAAGGLTAARFGFGARTGGLNANQWIDDLQITSFLNPWVGISQQPFSQTVVQGDNATFDTLINNPAGATLQWYKDGVAIPGANWSTLVVSNVQPAITGSKYKLVAAGPYNTNTSAEVTLSVTNLALPSSPQLSLNFDNGQVPAGTTTLGTALVDSSGGVNGSGTLKLTANVNDQNGAFLIADPAAGAPVYGFTARFKMLVGGGTTPPADGFAFAFGSDIPDDPSTNSPNRYEEGEGLGTGLRVTFDIYNNDGIYGYPSAEAQPAPSIDVRFGSQVLATTQFPVSFMETGTNSDGTPAFDDTIIQMNTDGTLNVVYRGDLVFDHLPIPGFSSVTGGRFAFVGRTGGLNANIWVDNIELTTITNSSALRITTQPASQSVLVNHAVTFGLGVNDPAGVTYQWLRNGTSITGANSSSYTIPSVALTDSNVGFSVIATQSSQSITSAVATLTVVNLTAPASPNYTFNFNDGLVPSGTAIYGNASVTATGGVGDSGVLHLTDAVNSENSAFLITNAVLNGAQVSSIAASFDVLEGGGSSPPADGWSFNFASDLTSGLIGNAETGTGTGITIAFRVYIGSGNADSPPSPYIGVKYKGNFVASTQIPASQLETGSGYRTVLLRVDPDGKLYLAYGDLVLYNGLQLTNYSFIANGKFGFYGRTGGANENQWFDNINLQATKSAGPLTVTAQPTDVLVIAGQTATFSVGVSDPAGATYQWYKNNTQITGANAATYTTSATSLADNGAIFKVTATAASGTATSSNATLSVVAPITVNNPTVLFDFNDGAVPPGTTLTSGAGGGYVTGSGGVNDSGCLHLTDAVNGQAGTFVIPDPATNQPIAAITVHFSLLEGGGTIPPADGFSFVWCPSNELPANLTFGEDGAGSGLIVSVDIYDNGNETPPAPSIDVHWRGNFIASKQIPYPQLETGTAWGDVFIRVSSAGLVDVQYNGVAIFNQVQLPAYAPLAGGEFAFGGRTGGLNENQWLDNIQIATTIGSSQPVLGFSSSGKTLTLTWGAGSKLQSSPSLAPASWTDVPNATSPYQATLGSGSLFYRLAPTP